MVLQVDLLKKYFIEMRGKYNKNKFLNGRKNFLKGL